MAMSLFKKRDKSFNKTRCSRCGRLIEPYSKIMPRLDLPDISVSHVSCEINFVKRQKFCAIVLAAIIAITVLITTSIVVSDLIGWFRGGERPYDFMEEVYRTIACVLCIVPIIKATWSNVRKWNQKIAEYGE